MAVPRVRMIPVGRMDAAEVENAAVRLAKVLRAGVVLREPLALPRGTEDTARGQHDAPRLLSGLLADGARGKDVKTLGAAPAATVAPAATAAAAAPATPGPEVFLFVTDVDLFTATTDGVWLFVDAPHRAALLSVRRLREAFYRRKADPVLQRTRVAKESLRAAARVSGLPDCNDPKCALSAALATGEIDRKQEHYCAACWKRLSAGSMRL